MTYRIEKTHYYYAHHINPPADHLVREYNYGKEGDILEFDTLNAAQGYIDNVIACDDRPYALRHGEYAAPSYSVVDDAAPDCLPADGTETGGTPVAEGDVPLAIRDCLLDADVELVSSHGAYDVFAAFVYDNDNKWGIIYCPTSIAIDMHQDDLSLLDWDKYAFCKSAR